MPLKLKENFTAKTPYADCNTCPLRDNTFVPPDVTEIRTKDGYSTCNVAWVGNYPDEEEAKAGQVFIGEAGKLLKQVTQGLKKLIPWMDKQIYLNSVLCSPHSNEEVNEDARNHCYKGVWHLLETYKPELIIGMGPEGLKTTDVYTGTILDKHGSYTKVNRRSVLDHGKKFISNIISSVHPAYVVRPTGTSFYQEYVDGLFHGISNYLKPIPEPEYEILNTVEQITALEELIPDNVPVALDIETANLKLYDEIICIQVSSKALNNNKSYIIEWPANVKMDYNFSTLKWDIIFPAETYEETKIYYERIKSFLENPKFRFILQNANFDKPQLGSFGIDIEVEYDTLLESHITNENARSHSLKYQARLRLGWPDWDTPIMEFINRYAKSKKEKAVFRWTQIPRKELYKYAAFDSPGTEELHHIFYDKEMDEGDKNVHDVFSIPALNMFSDIRTRGLRIDAGKTIGLVDDTKKLAAKIFEERIDQIAYDNGFETFNPNSPKQVAELLYDKLEISLPIERGKEVRSTNKKLFEQLPQLDIIQAIKEYREATHDIDAYYLSIAGDAYGDICIHPHFDLTLRTGRIATSNPAILNVKKSSRVGEMFIPYYPNDYWMLKIDQAQFELRFFAGITGAESMIDAFMKGVDVHGYFGVLMDPNYEKAYALNPDVRTRIKNVVFGTLFNAGDYQNAISATPSALQALRLSDLSYYEQVVTDKQAYEFWFQSLIQEMKKVREAFNELCPEADEFKDTIKNEIFDKGYIETVTGRKRHCPLVPNDNKAFKHLLNQMINSPVQGPASEINVAAAVDVHNHYENSMDAFVDTTYHDAIFVEADKNNWEEVLTTTTEYMTSAPARYLGDKYPIFKEVPFAVEAEIGTNWKNTTKVSKIDNKWVVENPDKIGMKV